MKKSIWSNEVKLPEFDSLKEDKKTDVLIIGGGLCGILCAYFLQKEGIDYILVESDKIASGITKNTTAKITSQHGLIYSKIIKDKGFEHAKMYLTANEEAIKKYGALCENIDCCFERKDAYTYSLSERLKIEEEVKALHKLGYNAEFAENLKELPFKTQGAICFKNQAQFNPLKFLKEIVKDLKIYENTVVRELAPGEAITDKGRVKANKIIVATHFPFINKHGGYFLKLYQHRSYVSAFEGTKKLSGMYVDENKKGLSFRSYGDYLLIGGGGHRTGKQGGAWQELQSFAERNFPNSKLCFQWAAQDCMSLDGIPYIGRYSKNTDGLYVATGFNKWGMTLSMVAATVLCDMIKEKKNDYAQVFSPTRDMKKTQLFVNGFEATKNLLTPTKKRCPHLGCALKWNKVEHTWDCPCHGSRFEENGKLIDNPATDDLKK